MSYKHVKVFLGAALPQVCPGEEAQKGPSSVCVTQGRGAALSPEEPRHRQHRSTATGLEKSQPGLCPRAPGHCREPGSPSVPRHTARAMRGQPGALRGLRGPGAGPHPVPGSPASPAGSRKGRG